MSINTNALWFKAYQFVLEKIIAPISWRKLYAVFNHGKYYSLTDEDLAFLRKAIADDYYVIATRRKTHLTTYLIALGSFLTTGRFSHYNHVLMNLEDDKATADIDFKLMEATGSGVHWSTFMEVFDCDSVALLRPKNITPHEWDEAVDAMKHQLGKPYDNGIDFSQSERESCVQMVNESLKGMDDYDQKFPELIAAIKKYGRVTPQQYYNCHDFEVVWEVRR